MLYEHDINLHNSPMIPNEKDIKVSSSPAQHKDDRPEQVTFEDLLTAVGQTKNRDAFIRLFEHFAPRIKSYLMKGGLTHELADELAQEAMLSVWQKAEQYDSTQSAASTWIFTIARNKKIDFLRKNARPQPDSNDPMMSPDITLPDEIIFKSDQAKQLASAIADLPDDQAKLIRKSFFEEKTHADIAQETNIPLGTVKSRIRLALEKLRHKLGLEGLEIEDLA